MKLGRILGTRTQRNRQQYRSNNKNIWYHRKVMTFYTRKETTESIVNLHKRKIFAKHVFITWGNYSILGNQKTHYM